MAMATMPDSRQPRISQMRIVTDTTAMAMWSRSSLDFSAAVAP